MIKLLSLFVLITFLSCTNDNHTPVSPYEPPSVSFALFGSQMLSWYRDSILTDWIKPSTYAVMCQGGPCVIISTGGTYDYTCTTLPDTFYGLIEYSPSLEGESNDTLFCHGSTCYDRKHDKSYDMANYFFRLTNSICSPEAAAYSKIGLCMTSLPFDTLRVWNYCFDSTIATGSSGSFCLPKLPFPLSPPEQGVYISSSAYQDTAFISLSYINSYNDYIAFPQ